ncbi:MAG TPA: hypothetical protein VFH08_19955 [Chitinophagaceae bacterium]|nr:hypothetical protein [Chitinophagaceae bacterium]
MQKVHVLILFTITFLLANCSPSNKTSGVSVNKQKPNGRSFHKIFIEVATVDIQTRLKLETDLVATIISDGYAAVKSLDMIPFSLKEPRLPTKDEIESKVKESGCDAILIVSVLRKGETIEYTPGTVTNANSQFLAGILGDALKKGGNINPVPGVNIPGSFSHGDPNFILQSNLYDVPAEELIFSVRSENIDMSSLDKTGKTYSATLIAQLKKEKLLKR